MKTGGHWHLNAPPKALSFPIAGGYRYQPLPINPNASYVALHARLKAIQTEQLAYAVSVRRYEVLVREGVLLRDHELEAIDAGRYLYPHMKMQEVAQFHSAYKTNLDAWQAGNKSKVEAHWRAAFSAAEDENGGTWINPARWNLCGRCCRRCRRTFVSICRAPWQVATPITRAFQARACKISSPTSRQWSRYSTPRRRFRLPEIKDETHVFDPGHYGAIQDVGMAFIFSVPEQRQHTWEKAMSAAGAMRAGTSSKHFDKRMRQDTTTAHPNAGDNDFIVDGTDVGGDFDWMHQPGAKAILLPAPRRQMSWPPTPAVPSAPVFQTGARAG